MSDQSKKREEEEARLYPEITDGYEAVNKNGVWVAVKKKEQWSAIPRGFIIAGIIGELNNNAVKVLMIISCFSNRFKNTTITDKKIKEYANVCKNTLTKVLRELEFYHIISRHFLPGGSIKKRRRMINIFRWDTARAILIKEKKIKLGLDNKVVFVIPNPFRK